MNDLDFMKKFKEKDKDQNNYLPPKVFLKVLKKNGVVIEESEQKEIIKIYSDQGKEEVYYQFFIQDLRKYQNENSPLKKKFTDVDKQNLLHEMYDKLIEQYENEKNFLEENNFEIDSQINRERFKKIFKELKTDIMEGQIKILFKKLDPDDVHYKVKISKFLGLFKEFQIEDCKDIILEIVKVLDIKRKTLKECISDYDQRAVAIGPADFKKAMKSMNIPVGKKQFKFLIQIL